MSEITRLLATGFVCGAVAVVIGAITLRREPGSGAAQWVPGILIAGAFIVGILSVQSLDLRFVRSIPVLIVFLVCTIWLGFAIQFWDNFVFVLLPFSLAAMFLVVPDTEQTLLLSGIVCMTLFFYWPLRLPMSRWSALLIAMTLSYVICADGLGRPASILVAIGTLGVTGSFPLLVRFRKPVPQSVFVILLHILGISIVIGLARTTSSFGPAALAFLAGPGVASIALILIRTRYYKGVSQVR